VLLNPASQITSLPTNYLTPTSLPTVNIIPLKQPSYTFMIISSMQYHHNNYRVCVSSTFPLLLTPLTIASYSRGAGTVSGQGGQRFLEKIRREAPKNFFSLPTLVFILPTLDLISWVGKNPPTIT